MSLSPAFLDELRARTPLSGLIGKSVKLQKAGREYKACCPFHSEKTPSFYVNDEKGFWHCFGCGVHGDAIRFLTDARGLPFIDAVKELADAAGMELPAADPRAREQAERAAGLHEVMAAAASWFAEQLGGIEGADARTYLEQRRINPETQKKFAVGYSPHGRAKLRDALRSFGNDALIQAGLLIKPDSDGEPYDRFRNRVIFPIRDPRGRVIAFGGRILGQGEPKYLNSPDTPLFDKGRTLFNLDKANSAARDAGRLIVVEGYMDVIALDQAGIAEVVAPLGTALTETQLQLLWRHSDQPLLCFDGDQAGERAAIRAAQRALPALEPGKSLGFVPLPPGKDPDDLIQGGGRAAFLGFLARAETLVDRLWRHELHSADAATPEARAGLRQRLLELADSVQDRLVREEYRRSFNDAFYEKFGWKKRDVRDAASAISQASREKRGLIHQLHRALLYGLSRYPEVLRDIFEDAMQLAFESDHHRNWFNVISLAVIENPALDEDLLMQILATSDASPIEKRDLTRDLAFSFFKRLDPEKGRQDLRDLIATLVAEQDVERAISAAQAARSDTMGQAEWEEHLRLGSMKSGLLSRLGDLMEAQANTSMREELSTAAA